MKPPWAETIHSMVNQQRKSKGCKSLQLDEKMCEVAQAYAEYLVHHDKLVHEDKNYLGGSTIGTRLNKKGVRWQRCGENLTNSPPGQSVETWMRSPGHRDNLLNRLFTKEGIGVAYNNGRWVCCQVLIQAPLGINGWIFFGVVGLISAVITSFFFSFDRSNGIPYATCLAFGVIFVVVLIVSSIVFERINREPIF